MTLIDECHDYTHSLKFEAELKNRNFREIVRRLMDAVQRLQNITSAQLNGGIYIFDLNPDEVSEILRLALKRMESLEIKK